MTDQAPDNPGVVVLPPLILLATIAAWLKVKERRPKPTITSQGSASLLTRATGEKPVQRRKGFQAGQSR